MRSFLCCTLLRNGIRIPTSVLPQLQYIINPCCCTCLQTKHDVEVDLSRCSALELRQIQHFVTVCREQQSADNSQHTQQQRPKTEASAANQQQQQQAEAAAPNTTGAAANASQAELAAGPTPVGQEQHKQHKQQQQQHLTEAPSLEVSDVRELTGYPASQLRDQTLSERAGIKWPGLLIGAGERGLSRCWCDGAMGRLVAGLLLAVQVCLEVVTQGCDCGSYICLFSRLIA